MYCICDDVGYIRLISTESLYEASKQLLNIIMENGWTVDRISFRSCVELVDGADVVLLKRCLASLGSPSADEEMWSLSDNLLARASAHIIFRSAGVKKVVLLF